MKQVSIRSMFVADEGNLLISFDFKQAESWIVAHLANEPAMIHSLANGDIHTDTACAIYNCKPEAVTKPMRYIGKKSNHALAYREGYLMFTSSVNKESDKPPYVVITNKEGKRITEAWHSYYNLKQWWAQIEYELGQNHRTLKTPYGRIRTFFAPWGNELFKEATAFLPQSTAVDHLNGAVQPEVGINGGLREIRRRYVEKGACKVVNQSHDSIIVEATDREAHNLIEPITQLLYRPMVINSKEFRIPVEVEIGTRWGELKKVA